MSRYIDLDATLPHYSYQVRKLLEQEKVFTDKEIYENYEQKVIKELIAKMEETLKND